MGARPAAPTVVAEEAEFLLPLCDDHARSHRGHGSLTPAAAVESELLSSYAVDLLPMRSLPAPPQEEEPPTGAWSWSRGPGKGVVVLVLASLLLRVVLLWAAMSSGGGAATPVDAGAGADPSGAAGEILAPTAPSSPVTAVREPSAPPQTSGHRRVNGATPVGGSDGRGGRDVPARAGDRQLGAAGAGAPAGAAAGTSAGVRR
jgi:hypothetical protein